MKVPQCVRDIEKKTKIIKQNNEYYLLTDKKHKIGKPKVKRDNGYWNTYWRQHYSTEGIKKEVLDKILLINNDVVITDNYYGLQRYTYAFINNDEKCVDIYLLYEPLDSVWTYIHSTEEKYNLKRKKYAIDTILLRCLPNGNYKLLGIDDKYNIVDLCNRSKKYTDKIVNPIDYQCDMKAFLSNRSYSDPNEYIYCFLSEDDCINGDVVDIYNNNINYDERLSEYRLRKHKTNFDIKNRYDLMDFLTYKPYVNQNAKKKYLDIETNNYNIINSLKNILSSANQNLKTKWIRFDDNIILYDGYCNIFLYNTTIKKATSYNISINRNVDTEEVYIDINSKTSPSTYFYNANYCNYKYTANKEAFISKQTDAVDKDGNIITIKELFKGSFIENLLDGNISFKTYYTTILIDGSKEEITNDDVINMNKIPKIMAVILFSNVGLYVSQLLTLNLKNIVDKLLINDYEFVNTQYTFSDDTYYESYHTLTIKKNLKSVTKAFFMTTKQLIVLNDHIDGLNLKISSIFNILRSYNISTLDLDIFKKLMGAKINGEFSYYWLWKHGKSPKEISEYVTVDGIDTISYWYFKDYERLYNHYSTSIESIKYNYEELKQLNDPKINEILNDNNIMFCKNKFPAVPPVNKLKDYHDRLTTINNRLYNISAFIQNKEDVIKFAETAKNNIKYNYTGEKYSMVVPISPFDLVTEGQVLSHCVGSYIHSVAKGEETIVFLRRNEDLSTPFFTVDVDKNGYIRQIKTKCNNDIAVCKTTINDKEVTWDPNDIVAFLKEWANNCDVDKTSILEHYDARCALVH